tara:strand:+ start:446 stop:838 length:393 start_codon:yes stop_codon:yes gene_type:complete
MKSLIFASFLGFLPFVKAQETDLGRLLEALCSLEGGKANEPGGRPCMSYQAWSDRTDLAYQMSMHEAAATPIFQSHLVWITKALRQNHLKPTPEAIATAWRFGVTKATHLKGKSEYGKRCANLYHSDFKP